MVIDKDSGEIVGQRFAKMFVEDIGALLSLRGSDINVLLEIVRRLSYMSGNTINLSPKIKKDIASKLGLKNHISITNSLHRLCDNGAISKNEKHDRWDYRYTVNPELFFSGNDYQRAKIIIEYSKGGRTVKAFPNSEEAEKWLHDN